MEIVHSVFKIIDNLHYYIIANNKSEAIDYYLSLKVIKNKNLDINIVQVLDNTDRMYSKACNILRKRIDENTLVVPSILIAV